MSNIAIISTSKSNSKNEENITKTLLTGESIQRCFNLGLITEIEKNILDRMFPNGYFKCWGTHDGLTYKQFDKLERNDIFVGGNHDVVDLVGKVVYVMERENSALGNYLWNSPEWKWIWFVSDIREINAPLDGLNRLLGYKPNNVIQGFTVKKDIDEDAINDYLNRF